VDKMLHTPRDSAVKFVVSHWHWYRLRLPIQQSPELHAKFHVHIMNFQYFLLVVEVYSSDYT